jgi:hypothetical protein
MISLSSSIQFFNFFYYSKNIGKTKIEKMESLSSEEIFELGKKKYEEKNYEEALNIFLYGDEKYNNEDCMYMLSKMFFTGVLIKFIIN